MVGGSSPMSSVSRPRTRSQWDDHYKNLHSEKRNNDGESGYNGDDAKSWEKHGFVTVGEKRCYHENINSSERRASKRTRNFINESVSLSNVRGKEKSDVRSYNTFSGDDVSKSDDDEVELLVISNDSSSKIGNSDEIGNTRLGADNVGDGEKRGRGRPRKKPLEQPKNIYNDHFCVDLENFTDSPKSSNESVSEEEDDEDEFSNEDYRASSSESSDDPYYSSYDEQEKDGAGENEKIMNGEEDDDSSYNRNGDEMDFSRHRKNESVEKKKENGIEQDHGNESDGGYNGDDHDINDDHKLPSVGKCRRKYGKRESEVEQEREDELDEGCHGIHDDSYCNKTSANRTTKDVEIMDESEDEENFPSIRKSKRIHQKGDAELVGLARTSYNGKEDLSPAKCYKPSAFLKFRKKGGEYKSSRDTDSCCYIERMEERGPKFAKKVFQLSKKQNSRAKAFDLIKILVESINSVKEHQSDNEENVLTPSTLPLRFGFEDEVVPPRVKSYWEKEIDSLFCDLELGLLESEIDCPHIPCSSVMENDDLSTEIDQNPAACCARGEHQPILDEQIGIICKYCFAVILEIKYVLPPFYKPPSGRQDRKDYDESSQAPSYFVDQIQFQDSGCGTRESTYHAKGTVWDLIPGVEKELYPHQREGFEFMWKNIAGNITIQKMKHPLSGGRGCIISHAPGTGKTRLTIVFLQTFLKLYPTCRPVIIAPRGMLLTWESEFVKWNVNIPFHNLNKKELSENENAFAAQILGQVGGGSGPISIECMRLIKLASWVFGRSILGISYQLFTNLVRENGERGGLKNQIKKLLLECPGLLVLDEGHTPRNDNSQIWNALSEVVTQRRVILSGTPFQNNLTELYNTLCIVNPRFVNEIESENKTGRETRWRKSCRAGRKKWMNFTSSIGLDTNDGLKKLRAMLDPFVHVHKGTILKESLPGLRDTLVFLHPTELQKVLLEASSKTRNIFHRIRQVSLASVHPSLMVATAGKSLPLKSKLEEIESVDAGVKTRFVMKLIRLADALGERVLIFSQFLDPLEFIKKQIKYRFSWKEGRELLYMDGQLDERQRQDSISSFNDDTSEAKVLLASERACSEGINLIGASRVVLLDTVWNPSVEKQAVSRAYRLGQKKVVYVYRLFTSGTEVRQYAQQIQKERISQLLFSPVDGQQTCNGEGSVGGSEDKVLEAMLCLERLSRIFEKIIRQPKESDLIEIFGLVEDQN